MQKNIKYSKCKPHRGRKPTSPRMYTYRELNGDSVPIGTLESVNARYNLVKVNGNMMWEDNLTGALFPYLSKNIPIKVVRYRCINQREPRKKSELNCMEECIGKV